MIGWEEGSNPTCPLYLANQGSRSIAGSKQRCLGGVRHLCVSSFLALAPVDSFWAGIVPPPPLSGQELCHLLPLSPLGGSAWLSVTLDGDVQQTTEDNGNAGLGLPKGKFLLTQTFLDIIFYI